MEVKAEWRGAEETAGERQELGPGVGAQEAQGGAGVRTALTGYSSPRPRGGRNMFYGAGI